MRLRVALTLRPAGELEPLVSSGTAEAQDIVFLRRVAPTRCSFVLRLADGSEVESGVVDLEPLVFHPMRFDFDRVAGEVRVAVAAREVARLPGRLLPLQTTLLLPGRGARGKGAADLGRFSGAFVTEDMELAADDALRSLPALGPSPALLLASADALPAEAEAGQVAAIAGTEGARLHDGRRWRWIPLGALDRVRAQRTLPHPPASGEVTLFAIAGGGAEQDALLLRILPAGRAQVVLRTAAGPTVEGERWSWRSDEPLLLNLDNVMRTVDVTVGDTVVLRTGATLLPLRPQQLALP